MKGIDVWWKVLRLTGKGDLGRWFRFFQESQYWDKEKIEELQRDRLVRVLGDAFRHVPFYKNNFYSFLRKLDRDSAFEILFRLPVVDKNKIRASYGQFLRNPLPRGIKINQTGGTTGQPFRYHTTWETWALMWGAIFRVWSFAGYTPGDRLATLATYSLSGEKTPLISRLRTVFEHNLTLPSIHLTGGMIDDYLDRIERHRSRFVRGYPSALDRVAVHILDGPGGPWEGGGRLKAVITTSEVLRDEVRKRIEEAFGVPVFNEYGCRDGGIIAGECEKKKGIHYSWDRAYLEFGKNGEVIVTDLWQTALPFIRYVNGDTSSWNAETVCPCGRTLPLLSGVVGRSTDQLAFPNGRTVSGPSLTVIAGRFPILEYQFVRDRESHVDVFLVVEEGRKDDPCWKRMKETLSFHFGEGVAVDLHFVPKIERAKSGKLRIVVDRAGAPSPKDPDGSSRGGEGRAARAGAGER